jgi:hypothetical protein
VRTKIKVIAGAAVVGLVGAGGAFAFFNSTGTGTGSAKTATPEPLGIVQTVAVTGLMPGATPLALAGTFTNPNTGPLRIGNLVATVDAAALPSGCGAGNYLIGGSFGGVDVPPGVSNWSGLTIQLQETGVSQDACIGATVGINYVAAP